MKDITIAARRAVVRIPRVGDGQFSPQLFDAVGMVDQAFILAILEAAMPERAPRMLTGITRSICGPSVPATLVADRARRLQRTVAAWQNRPLGIRPYPFLVLNAMEIDVQGQVRGRHRVLVAAAITEHGYPEVVGIHMDDGEPEGQWSALFDGLRARGLRGVDLAISARYPGMREAFRATMPGALWQWCQDNALDEALALAPEALRPDLRPAVRHMFDAPDRETAATRLDGLVRDWRSPAPRAVQMLSGCFGEMSTVMALPPSYRARLRTTRMLKRIATELERPQRVIGTFPSAVSAERLIGAIAMETERAWSVGPRYLAMSAYLKWKETQSDALSVAVS